MSSRPRSGSDNVMMTVDGQSFSLGTLSRPRTRIRSASSELPFYNGQTRGMFYLG